jgi:hypothetical protein
MEILLVHSGTVHEGAVGRAQIVDAVLIADAHDLGVLLRHRALADPDLGVLRAADHHLGAIEGDQSARLGAGHHEQERLTARGIGTRRDDLEHLVESGLAGDHGSTGDHGPGDERATGTVVLHGSVPTRSYPSPARVAAPPGGNARRVVSEPSRP